MIKRLLLSKGGGIIARDDLVPQANAVTIAIGLGGTGVDCLREFKQAVYTRLLPDSDYSDVPQYNHIKFLAVDSDESSLGDTGEINSFNRRTEFFNISANDIGHLLAEIEGVADLPEEYAWLETKAKGYSSFRILNAHAGAGGVRQVGRFLFMRKSAEFLRKVKILIAEAQRELPGDSEINILIFTGLGGGTGSGIFLDVCYIVKQALADLGISWRASTLGFFFMPDVNISKIDMISMRKIIEVNGYAAMKELDYCMNFAENHGTWNQKYDGFKVETTEPPVNLAHLVTATKADGSFVQDAYRYSMQVVTEYVMEFLKKPYVPENACIGATSFTIKSYIGDTNQVINVIQSKRANNGVFPNYCVVGASSYYVPYKEIDTYLVSKIFESIRSINNNRPTESDLNRFCNMLGLSYENIASELNKDVPSVPMSTVNIDMLYSQCMGISSGAIPQSLKYMVDAKAVILGKVHENKMKMLSDDSATADMSVLAKVKTALKDIAADPQRGPLYARAMLCDNCNRDLIAVIDGYIVRNYEHICQARADFEFREKELEVALYEFQKSWKLSRKRTGEAYIYAVNSLVTAKLKINFFEEMNSLLESLKVALKDLYDHYFNVFANFAIELEETFDANLHFLLSNPEMNTSCAKPLMTIAELKEMLDNSVRDMNIFDVMHGFLISMLDRHEDAWLSADENRIANCVSDYFLHMLCARNRMTVSNCLSAKFDTNHPGVLTRRAKEAILYPAIDAAEPLFRGGINQAGVLAYCAVPQSCNELDQAATEICDENPIYSKRTLPSSDWISVVKIAIGIEACQCKCLIDCGRSYHHFAFENFPGCHIQESFRQLPDVVPQALLTDS